jgi:hypothetical protein
MKEATLNIENQIDELKEISNDYQRIREVAVKKIQDLENKIKDLDNLFLEEKNNIYGNIKDEMMKIKDHLKNDGECFVLKSLSCDIKLFDKKVKVKRNNKKLIEFVTLTNPTFIQNGDIDWSNYSKILLKKDNKFFDNHGNEVEGLYMEECPEKIEIYLKED